MKITKWLSQVKCPIFGGEPIKNYNSLNGLKRTIFYLFKRIYGNSVYYNRYHFISYSNCNFLEKEGFTAR
ncbi:hypothetical protein BN1088_1430323 [Sphingobacterium sp. PM2-P1-29]|nr:hypothetical protein BN1088_1430323 [Sphingobacterium sp. PM2-P1-29]